MWRRRRWGWEEGRRKGGGKRIFLGGEKMRFVRRIGVRVGFVYRKWKRRCLENLRFVGFEMLW